MHSDLTTRLAAIFEHVRNSSLSDFYRTLYKDVSSDTIATLKDFETLPFVTKSLIQSVPFWDRIYIPESDVTTIVSTSGTSGSGPLFIPQTRPYNCPLYLKSLTATIPLRMLQFFGPCQLYETSFGGHSFDQVVHGDLGNLRASAQLAAGARVNALDLIASTLEQLIPELERYDVPRHIRLVEIDGERLSPRQKAHFSETFPNAVIYNTYGLMETQGQLGFPAAEIYPNDTDAAYDLYTPEEFYVELVDENGNVVVEPHTEGEVVGTTLQFEGFAFPIVRYRTGDMAEYTTWDPDPSKRTYKLLGRTALDYIKLPGGRLLVEEVERVISLFQDTFESSFELHFYKTGETNTNKPHVVLHLIPKNAGLVENEMALAIAENLLVSPTVSYHDNVVRGLYAPLQCIFKEALPKQPGRKTVKFFRHDHD